MALLLPPKFPAQQGDPGQCVGGGVTTSVTPNDLRHSWSAKYPGCKSFRYPGNCLPRSHVRVSGLGITTASPSKTLLQPPLKFLPTKVPRRLERARRAMQGIGVGCQ